ncbi:MAG: ribonucrease [Pseudonocardiales bacterium]|jgi:ribonuclease Y|nr:ribonucrease [Pseudonocardiales bacterium]
MGHVGNLAAVVAGFVLILVLGLRFLSVYATGRTTRGAHEVTDSGQEAAEQLDLAESAAESIRQRAEREAVSLRRSVAAEADALRRAAQSEAEAARAGAEAATANAEAVRRRAESEAADLLADARRTADVELQARRSSLDVAEGVVEMRTAALDQRETELDRALATLAEREHEHDHERLAIAGLRDGVEKMRIELAGARELLAAEQVAALERFAGLTADQAKVELLASVESTARRDAASLVRKIEAEARAEGTDRARAIVVEAVQRVASEQTSETVVSVLHLPSDEMKGRIIGREGRNIRAFESVTGVNVIIDDTPEAVLLSCFDPVRREVGRITLEKLVLDGRIHPHRIEEVYETAKTEVDELCFRAARDALADVGITDLDDRLIPTLGRLKYRTSYGQNVLGHLIETAHIAGVMASELGLEPALIKRSAFLHDIGKALTHEVEGSHAIIGAELLRKYGEDEAVAHAVEAHHNEVQPRTVEAVLTQAADACSAARPGARRESLETYVKRLQRIEEIAGSKPGVEKVFAMQSGREVRVMVLPNVVDDLAAGVIAREVAKQIEDELTYPGQIRVTVVRESRATEVAH